MALLGDFFKAGLKKKLIENNIVCGSVLRIPVKNTKPPKIKYILIVGIDDSKISYATIFINSDVNMNVLNTPELQNLQVWIDPSKCNTVKIDSYADCSSVYEQNISNVIKLVEQDGDCHTGTLNGEYYEAVMDKISKTDTIPLKTKEKYNLA